MPSRQKDMRGAARPDGAQRAATFDIDAEVAGLIESGFDEKDARSIAESRARYHAAKHDAWMDAAVAQAARIEWPDPASLPRPDDEPGQKCRTEQSSRKVSNKPADNKADGVRPTWKWEGFAQIPYPLVVKLLRALPDVALRVYVALRFFEGYDTGEMHPGQDLLAVLTGLGERGVWAGVEILRGAGLIEGRRRWNTSNSYTLVEITAENWPAIKAKLEAMSKRMYPRPTKLRREREPALLKQIEKRRQSRTTVRN